MNYNNRPLGAAEKVFWLLDQVKSVHFVIAAEINGPLTTEKLRKALDAVQERHPLFCSYICSNGYEQPYFKYSPGMEIPLRVAQSQSDNQLDVEMAKELSIPFNWRKAPLIRAVLIEGLENPVVVFAVCHAISDGISMTWVIRDLLEVLNGKTLAKLGMPPSIDDLIGLSDREALIVSVDDKANDENILLSVEQAIPQVHRLRYSAELTNRLTQRVRDEGVTVHGALYAAVINACKKIGVTWAGQQIRVVNPFSVRTQAGAGEDSCLYINSKIISLETIQDDTFWNLARYANVVLESVHHPETVKTNTTLMRQRVFNHVPVAELSEALQAAVARELMISNLGRISYTPDFGAFSLKAIWGPLALSGTDEEITIGVTTTNGTLCLSAVSRSEQVSSILDMVRAELTMACL